MPQSKGDVTALLHQARSGDVEAFARLFDRYRQLVRLMMRSQMSNALRQKADSEDILQETFLTAVQSIRDFKGEDPDAFVRWLQVIAARRVCDAYRRFIGSQKRAADREISIDRVLSKGSNSTDRLAAQLAGPFATPSRDLHQSELLLQLANALAQLPDHYQEAIHLRFVEQMTIDQIAEHIGKTRGSAAMSLSRAVNKLREIMKLNTDHG